MREVAAIATSFPTVIFSVLLLVAVTYWIVSIVGGFGLEATDGIGEGGDGEGLLDGLASLLNIDDIPLPLSLSLWAALAWFVSFVLSQVSTAYVAGVAVLPVALLVIVVSLLAGFVPVTLLARVLGKVLKDTPATSRNDLVGKHGLVVTGSVTGTFGSADVLIPGGAPAHVQVRYDGKSALSKGDTVLLVEYDEDREAFLVVMSDSSLY